MSKREEKEEFIKHLEFCTKEAHENSVRKGFYDGVVFPLDYKERATRIALMHSELSEVLEALRCGSETNSEKLPGFSAEEEELADLFIRLLDYCGACEILLAEAVLAKMGYNATRPHKHGKEF